MYTVDDYVNKRVAGNWKTHRLSLLGSEFWKLSKITIPIEIMLLEYVNEWVDVPVGTKDKPAGITNMGDQFVSLVNLETMDITKPFHVALLKRYIKENAKDLDRDFSADYKALCFRVNVQKLVEYVTSFSSPSDGTSRE